MEIVITLSQNREEEYRSAVETGVKICLSVLKDVTILSLDDYNDEVVLNRICLVDSPTGPQAIQKEDDELVDRLLYPWVDDSIKNTKEKLESLKQRLQELKANKPRLGLHSVEDVDDLYQARYL